jgi:hypothetical protein
MVGSGIQTSAGSTQMIGGGTLTSVSDTLMTDDSTRMVNGGTPTSDDCTLSIGGRTLRSIVVCTGSHKLSIKSGSHITCSTGILNSARIRIHRRNHVSQFTLFYIFYANGSDLLILYRVKGPSLDSAMIREIITSG